MTFYFLDTVTVGINPRYEWRPGQMLFTKYTETDGRNLLVTKRNALSTFLSCAHMWHAVPELTSTEIGTIDRPSQHSITSDETILGVEYENRSFLLSYTRSSYRH